MLLFWTFRGWKIWSFWGKKLMERLYLLVTEKFLFWTFPLWRNTVIFEAKSKWKDDIYWLVKSSYFWATEKFLFWVFRWWEIRPFFSQKVHVKVIFTWVFWAFHDTPGLGKYGFSCSVTFDCHKTILLHGPIRYLENG